MSETLITTERHDHVFLIGLNRPQKRNAFTLEMLRQLALACGELEADDDLWAGVLFAHGDHFTAGLDLGDVAPEIQANGTLSVPEGGRQPWRLDGVPYTTPIVTAVQGWCITLGIELLLASDVRVAASDTRFTQLEVQRGIYPFGGATIRMPREAGWGNAMRWLLTGDEFDAAEAYRIGLVQEVVEPGRQVERAVELAQRIANVAAPLGVRATLASAQAAIPFAEREAANGLQPDVIPLMQSADGAEGLASFVERRPARFTGR
ncbi:crotonase/enoyl-CoA hydratase family protein [Conexibacter sp. CPCC 206217]|uniref:crotonase/enoyl-CoA hydratase family protein n=1 Tax=Conexibacter sp. CPCC 206217 TaxID=3064574 RepID=UPI00271AC599|nr:crotonase/enoyl-CoA hydratase family protein [Conexibacter sp. CPCC 206217]MDO8211792.1 crotonase/enoyl-CoA hydratase family protein [Conexibacter sp. CPCC 206217]